MRPVVGHSVNPFLFGTGSWVYGQISPLKRYRAVVVAKRRENARLFPWDEVHVRDELPLWQRPLERLGRRRRGYYPFMERALSAAGARLLHSHFGSQGWNDLPLARALGVPLFVSVYGADIWKLGRQAVWRERYTELFGEVHTILCEGSAMRAKLIELGCPPERAVVQHLGVSLDGVRLEERAPEPDGTVRLLAAGRAVEKKGFDLAARALGLARERAPELRLSLMMLARSAEERALVAATRALVGELGFADVIDFPAPMPYDEYRRALRSYHVFLCPSRHASNGDAEGGAPVSILEMSASGMPIVASEHCDIPEVAPHGVAGLLFPENDVEAFAERLVELARAPERWGDYARAGRAHVEREYDVARQAALLEERYDAALG